MDLKTISELLASRKPGHCLPQALYNDAEVYAFDLEAIYARSWLMAGFEVEAPSPGSYLSLMIGPWPVLIVRDRQGELRAFHNSCRHRGAQICPVGAGKSQRLVCPYHRWTYELTGELVSSTRMPPDFDPKAHGLAPIHLETVAGMIFICLADRPPAFAEFRAAFAPLLAPHGLTNAKIAYETTLVEKANWKLVMENARECYHCPGSHPELSVSFPIHASAHFDYGEDRRLEQFNARMAEIGLPVGPVEGDWWQAMRFALNEGCVSMTMDGQSLTEKLMCPIGEGDIGSLRLAIEPHGFFHAAGDFAFMFSALPLGPNETLVVAKWLVRDDAVEGVDYDVGRLIELWNTTNLQDLALVENNQRGVNARGYQPGPFSAEAEALALRFVDWYCAAAQDYLVDQGAASRAPAPRLRTV